MAEILPPQVVTAELFGDDLDAFLLPEEEAILGRVGETRRRQFTSGRACARQALGYLGVPPVPILAGRNRQPLWPEGIVGSITHCARYTAAAVCLMDHMATIGIDAEPHAALPRGVLDKVSLGRERAWLRALAGSGIWWDRVLFCAKEAVYKAWFPIAGEWLGFEDVLITVDAESQTFQARLLVPGPTVEGQTIQAFDGRCVATDELVLAAVAVPTPNAESSKTSDTTDIEPRPGRNELAATKDLIFANRKPSVARAVAPSTGIGRIADLVRDGLATLNVLRIVPRSAAEDAAV